MLLCPGEAVPWLKTYVTTYYAKIDTFGSLNFLEHLVDICGLCSKLSVYFLKTWGNLLNFAQSLRVSRPPRSPPDHPATAMDKSMLFGPRISGPKGLVSNSSAPTPLRLQEFCIQFDVFPDRTSNGSWSPVEKTAHGFSFRNGKFVASSHRGSQNYDVAVQWIPNGSQMDPKWIPNGSQRRGNLATCRVWCSVSEKSCFPLPFPSKCSRSCLSIHHITCLFGSAISLHHKACKNWNVMKIQCILRSTDDVVHRV